MIMGNQKRFLDLFKDVAGRLTWRLLGFYDKDDLLPFEETQARYSAESWRETSAPVLVRVITELSSSRLFGLE
jgi:hypothetical protein